VDFDCQRASYSDPSTIDIRDFGAYEFFHINKLKGADQAPEHSEIETIDILKHKISIRRCSSGTDCLWIFPEKSRGL
jgi:hypothetical protein